MLRDGGEEERCPVELFAKMGELDLMGLLVPTEHGGTGVSHRRARGGAVRGRRRSTSRSPRRGRRISRSARMPAARASAPRSRSSAGSSRSPRARSSAPSASPSPAPAPTRAVSAPRPRPTATAGSSTARRSSSRTPATAMSLGPIVLARIAEENGKAGLRQPARPARHRRASRIGPKLRGIGWHALDSRELTFDDVRARRDHLIGDARRGLAPVPAVLDVGRITVATLGIAPRRGGARAGARRTRRTACSSACRSPSSRPIQFKLADIAAQLEAVKLLVLRAARLRDASQPFGREGAMAKLLASELAVQGRLRGSSDPRRIRLHAGVPGVAFLPRRKVLEIGEGTNEIQRLVIARHLGC